MQIIENDCCAGFVPKMSTVFGKSTGRCTRYVLLTAMLLSRFLGSLVIALIHTQVAS